METTAIHVKGIGWVLPWGVGRDPAPLSDAPWQSWDTADLGDLEGFSAKPYLQSVKGYLDPAGAFCLAACAMALGRNRPHPGEEALDRSGISSVSRFGATLSGFRFFEQFLTKGPRYASPLVFPHGYANTAGNLAAIEFGFGGPHMVLYGPQKVAEAVAFAVARLRDGSADRMLVTAYESAEPKVLPEGMSVLPGAVALLLGPAADEQETLFTLPPDLDADGSPQAGEKGSVQDMLAWLLPRL